MRRLAAVACLATVLSTVAGSATADVGTGIQTSPVALTKPASPGSVHDLNVFVQNTGSERSSYQVRLNRLGPARPGTTAVPASWATFAPAAVDLEPKQGRAIVITLRIPSTARQGSYFTHVVAGTSVPGSGTAGLGAQAATELAFEVTTASPVSRSAADRPGPSAGQQLLANPLTVAASGVVGALALLAAVYSLGRRRGRRSAPQ